jgi:predicted nucleotidyltransferase
MRNPEFPYLPKDFIQTKQGLIFAVVSYQQHDEKVGCFLRYVKTEQGWNKVTTAEANQLLHDHYPQYLYQSEQFDAAFHAVSVDDIVKHHCPEQRLPSILQAKPSDEIEHKLHRLYAILVRYGIDGSYIGITGSMLINQQTAKSDIDLVIYGRDNFFKVRQAVELAMAQGELDALDQALMLENFDRRASELSIEEFSWHEYRKFNKASVMGTKFDLGMVCLADEIEIDQHQYKKIGTRTFITKVLDDRKSFDFPAVYIVDDKQTSEIVSFTHTYVGQAMRGEVIEVSGAVERNNETGKSRLIVGSSREAIGEYIKVSQ